MIELVAIAEMVDEPGHLRLGADQRAAVDQPAHLRRRQFARGCDAVDDLPLHRAQQILDLLALRCGHAGLGEEIGRRLVLLAMRKAGFDAELVEHAAQVGHLGIKPDQPDRPQWLQPDFVERRSEVIGPRAGAELAEAVGESDRELAFGAEIADRVAHLLAGREPEIVGAQLDIEPLDARILGGAIERVKKVAQRGLAAEHQLRQRVRAAALCQAAVEIGAQHDGARQARPACRKAPDRDARSDDREHRQETDRGKQADDKAAHQNSVLSLGNPPAAILALRGRVCEAFKIGRGSAT